MYKYLSISISIGCHIVKLVITTQQKPTKDETDITNVTPQVIKPQGKRKKKKNYNKQLTR